MPKSLRTWFVVHFVVDVLAAVPLFVAPTAVLKLLGWGDVDPLATRLVAAALFGIGIESWIGRNGNLETFRSMLNLKVIWSATATIGALWTQLDAGPPAGWAVVGIFASFFVVWVTYRIRVRASNAAPALSGEIT